jgi:hypothetical protein
MQKVITVVVTVTISFLFFTCSGLDTYTNAGSDIVKMYDSTLVKFESNFNPILFDTSIVTDVHSIPAKDAGSGFGYHGGNLAAGTDGQFQLYGSTRFTVSRSFAANFDASRKFDSITFVYDTIGDSAHKCEFDRSFEVTLYKTTLKKQYYLSTTDTAGLSLCVLNNNVSDSSARFTGKLDDSLLQDSIFSVCRLLDSCLEDGDCDSTIDTSFYVALFNRNNNIIWFNYAPVMVIHSTDTTNDTAIYYADTIVGSSLYMANESDSLKTVLEKLPVSTYLSRRTAVFKLDFSSFWDSLEQSDFHEILSAAIVLETDTICTEYPDSTSSIIPLFTNEIISDGRTVTERFDSAYATYFSYIDTVHASADTLTIYITRHLQTNLSDKPKYFFLYLQIESSKVLKQHEIYWKKPQIKAVLTTKR